MRKNKNKYRPVRGFAVLFALLLAICTAWIVFDDLFAPLGEVATSVEIPLLCGTRAEMLVTEDWMDVRIEYRYDPETPTGVVIAQSPAAGSRRRLTAQKPRCELRLTVSLGTRSLAMPEVIGRDARAAEAELRALGLTVRKTDRSSAYPEGRVLESQPRAGELLPEGATVTLTVSAGMPTATATVPDLRGLTRSEALVKIWLSQLTVGEVVEIDADAPAGEVVRQSLVAGTRVAVSSEISLYVSRAKYEE